MRGGGGGLPLAYLHMLVPRHLVLGKGARRRGCLDSIRQHPQLEPQDELYALHQEQANEKSKLQSNLYDPTRNFKNYLIGSMSERVCVSWTYIARLCVRVKTATRRNRYPDSINSGADAWACCIASSLALFLFYNMSVSGESG